MKKQRPMDSGKIISLLANLVWWLAASLISIAALGWSVPLGFAFAAVGGVGLGILLFRDDPQ
jgi:hypothetical protein